jgi:hypothetical protein
MGTGKYHILGVIPLSGDALGVPDVQGRTPWWIGKGIIDRGIGCVLTFIKARRVNEIVR